MTRLPLLSIIYVRACIIQHEIHKKKLTLVLQYRLTVNKKKPIKSPVKNTPRCFLVLNVSDINISDNKVHDCCQ